MALLHLLLEQGFSKLTVCHLDHGLRGRASTGDGKFVEGLAAGLDLPSEIGRTDVASLAERTSESLETAARRARHEFFRECASKHRCGRVLLAHHADDQAETVLWNLLRGSHGLRGMREVQRIGGLEFHRPLLRWRRGELREWLAERKLSWREDASNAEPIAVRNRLRHEALPLLAEISGRDPVKALEREASAWEEQRAITEWALKKADVLDPQGRLHVPALRVLPIELQRAALARFLAAEEIANVDRETLERGISLLQVVKPPVINLPGGKYLRRRGGRMFVE